MKKDVLSINDITKEEVGEIFSLAQRVDRIKKKYLDNKHFALFFEKPSLRTRLTFEIAVRELGGSSTYLTQQDIQLGKREEISDISQNLSLWCAGIIARVFIHSTLEEIARHSNIPVINALSNWEHPCQALTDVFTIKDVKKNKNIKVCYVGDGGSNVCHSLVLLSTKLGLDTVVSSPDNYFPHCKIQEIARYQAKENNCLFKIESNPHRAATDADVIYTDVWVSMGQEKERKKREKVFPLYQINSSLLRSAKKEVIVLHCLPAHRGEEISSEVLDAHLPYVLRQAKNRLTLQKAILVWIYREGRKNANNEVKPSKGVDKGGGK